MAKSEPVLIIFSSAHVSICLCNESKNYTCKCCQRKRDSNLDTVPETHEVGTLSNGGGVQQHPYLSRPRPLVSTMSETSLHSLSQFGRQPRPVHARHSHQYSVPYHVPVGPTAERLGGGQSRRIRSEHSSPTLDPVTTWSEMPVTLDLLGAPMLQRPIGMSAVSSAIPTSRARQTPLHSPINTPITSSHSSVLVADTLQKPVSTLGAVMEEPIYESSNGNNMVSMFPPRPSVTALNGEGTGVLSSNRIAHRQPLSLSVNTQAQYPDFNDSYLTSAPPSATTAFFHATPFSIDGYSDIDGTTTTRPPSNYGGLASPHGVPLTPAMGSELFANVHAVGNQMNPAEAYDSVPPSVSLSMQYSQRSSAIGLSNVSSDSSEYPDPNMSRRPSYASSSYSNINAITSADSFAQWQVRADHSPAFGSQLSLYHENYDSNDGNMYAMSGNVSDDDTDFICMAPARRQNDDQSMKTLREIQQRQTVELNEWANQRLTNYNNSNQNTAALNNMDS